MDDDGDDGDGDGGDGDDDGDGGGQAKKAKLYDVKLAGIKGTKRQRTGYQKSTKPIKRGDATKRKDGIKDDESDVSPMSISSSGDKRGGKKRKSRKRKLKKNIKKPKRVDLSNNLYKKITLKKDKNKKNKITMKIKKI